MATILEIIALFIVPAVLVFFNVFPKKSRLHVLALVALIVVAIVYFQRWPLIKLGIDPGHLSYGLLPYFLFTLVGLVYIFTIAKICRYRPTTEWWEDSHFLFGFILVSVAQEFLYRGFLIPELKIIFSSALLVIVVNALLFTYIHAIYPNKLVNLSSAFLAGICFAGIYYFYPNLILISLSHMALNFAAAYFGIFTFRKY